MYVIKPVKIKDLNSIHYCATQASLGLTHLQKNKKNLEQKIIESEKAFTSQIEVPKNETYLFVLSNESTGEIVGTCGIMSRTNYLNPLFVFHIEDLPDFPESLPPLKEKRILKLTRYLDCPTEIGALFLLPELRQGGYGKLLSLSRFLFIASFANRFTDKIIANMRGYVDDLASPFWEGIGRHFLDMPLEKVFQKRAENENFLEIFLPKYPIYACLLNKEVQESISKVHPKTASALNMLLKQGFILSHDIDPFDGGPIIFSKKNDIKTVKESRIHKIAHIVKNQNSNHKNFLVSNLSLDFRACYADLTIDEDKGITLTEEIARALQVEIGDFLRYIGV